MNIFKICCIYFFVFSCASTKNKEIDKTNCPITLYRDGIINKDYWDILAVFSTGEKYNPHCEIVFSDQSFKVKEILNAGYSSVIFVTDDDKILRLAKTFLQKDDLIHYYKIYQELSSRGVPVVYTEYGGRGADKIEFLLQEKVNINLLLNGFSKHFEEYNKQDRDVIFSNFLDFIGLVSDFVFVADFHGDNIVYTDNKRWIALDYGASADGKFKLFSNKMYQLFSPSPALVATIENNFRKKMTDAQIIEEAKKLRIYKTLSFNCIVNNDPAIDNNIFILDKWKELINDRTVVTRIRKITGFI